MKQRNVGLDICRMLSMLGIVVLHVISMGGVQQLEGGAYTAKYWLTEWLYICALCSVDIFAIMSGYLGIGKKKASSYRAFELMAIVLFVCVMSTAGFVIASPEKYLNLKSLIKGIFPMFDGGFWYITNFIPLMFLQPYINKMIFALSEKQHRMLCISATLIFTVVPTAASTDLFKFDTGYSFVWLLCMYVLGAYLKRCELTSKKVPKIWLVLIFFAVSAALLFGNIFIKAVTGEKHRYFVGYTSPLTLLMGLCVFMFFKDLNIKKAPRIMGLLSSVTFDVYLIHGHVFIYEVLIRDCLKWVSDMAIYWVVPLAIAGAVVIYVLCTVIGIVRTKLFEWTRFDRLIRKFSEFIDKRIYANVSAQ